MTRFNRFILQVTLFICFSAAAHSDEMQEASKLFKQNQSAQALTKLENILTRQPKDAQARFLKASIMAEQGQTDEAIKIFTQLTAEFPDLPEPYNNLAVIYAAQGEYEKAKSALESAMRTHPSYATAYNNLGEIYAKMASQAYDKALQLDRSSNNAKAQLAMIKDAPVMSAKNTDNKIVVASLNKPAKPEAVTANKPDPATTIAKVEPVKPVPVKLEPAKVDDSKTEKPAVATASKGSPEKEALKAAQDWAKAWSARNASAYLAMYSADFATPDNLSRKAWEQQRRERIAKPQPITVSLINAKVTVTDENHAKVRFVQSYRSGSLKSTVRKTLDMVRVEGKWLIQAEVNGF